MFRTADSAVLRAAGFLLWPTNTSDETGEADWRNQVHFDLVLAHISRADLEQIIFRRPGRKEVRGSIKPALERLRALLGKPQPLDGGGS